uniref:Uncharacterized protein n=1 Tax=Onchocerca volvulus TaxID=6282 RepID=A0A8R1XZU1_ONCVO
MPAVIPYIHHCCVSSISLLAICNISYMDIEIMTSNINNRIKLPTKTMTK